MVKSFWAAAEAVSWVGVLRHMVRTVAVRRAMKVNGMDFMERYMG